MGQHSDILKFQIAEGYENKLRFNSAMSYSELAKLIVSSTIGLLDTLEYPEDWTEEKPCAEHLLSVATYMRTQKDWLYGVPHSALDELIIEFDKLSQ